MQSSEPAAREHIHFADETLLQQICNRDSAALAVLYDRHAQTVYNLILRIVREPANADELLQDTFWQVWQKADSFQHGNVAAWLYRIARNKSLDWLRRQKVRPPITLSLDGPDAMTPLLSSPLVEQTVAQSWQQQEVHQVLASLPPEQRHCLELAFFEGLSQRQIAEHMQTPLSTVKTRIQMALNKLERGLRAVGYRAGREGEG